MLNFNTLELVRCRSGSSGQAKAVALMPTALKTGLTAAVAILLLCCFSFQSAMAQCNPDITAPTAVCVGPYTIALNTNGNASIDPADIDAGSTDNCGAVTLSVAPSNVNCSVIGNVVVTLTVLDGAGNTNTCQTTVTVEDNLPPAITCPGTFTFNTCPANTAPANTGFATAIDNCGGPLAQAGVDCTAPYATGVTYCDVAGNGCTGNGITRTWRATFGGLTSSCTQTLIVNDNTPPVIDWNGASNGPPVLGVPPANTTLSCAAPVPAQSWGAATFSDNCDGSPTATITDVSTYNADPSTCANTQYVITRTYKLQDDCGNMVTHVQTITFTNSAPVITPPAAINMAANPSCQGVVTAGQATATVSDCTPQVQLITAFVVRNNVNNQIVNSGAGLNAAGTYPAGNYTVTYSAIDPCGLQGTATMAMNIIDNVSPTAICVAGSIQVSIPPTGTTTLTAVQVNNGSFDNCTPQSGLTFSLTGATFTCADVGGIFPDIVQLTVTDANGNSNTCTSSVNVVNNSPPAVLCKDVVRVLSAAPPFGGTIAVQAIELDNGSSDACDPGAPASNIALSPLQFHFVSVNGTAIAPTQSYTFDCDDTGVNTVIVRVREVDNNQLPNFTNDGFCTQTITIQDNTAPTYTCPAMPLTFQLDDDGMISMYDAWQTNSYPSVGGPVAIPDNDANGGSSIINVPTIGTVNDVNITFSLTHSYVGDLTAYLVSPQGTQVTLFSNPVNTTANCSGDNLSNITFDDQAANIHSVFDGGCTGGTPAVPSGTYHAFGTLSAFEGENYQGNWTLVVVDNQGSDIGTIDSWSLELTNSLIDQVAIGAADNCYISYTMTPDVFNCGDVGDQSAAPGIQNNNYTIVITDPSNNSASFTCPNGIIITDPVGPEVTCSPITVSTGSPDSQNNISTPGMVTVYPTDLVTGGLFMSTGDNGSNNPGQNNFQVTVPNLMTFTFDWEYFSNNSSTFYDKFGYYINGTFTQLTVDNGPLSQSGTASVTVTAGATFGFRALTTDNIEGEAEIWITNFSPKFAGAFKPTNWSGATSSNTNGKRFFYDACGVQSWSISKDAGVTYTPFTTFNCTNIGAPIPVIIRATDASNNQTTCNTTVTVVDKETPQAQCQPLLVSLPSSGTATVLASDINFGSTDACSPPVILAISKDNGVSFNTSVPFNCSSIGVNNVILRVRDSATPANEAFCATTVTVRDLLPPAITCPANITINCDQSSLPATTGLATALDNCAGVVTPTYTDAFSTVVSGNPAGNYNDPNCRTITRTWTATDNASPANTSLCFQTIVVQDLVAPSLDWNGATAGLGAAPTSPINVDACNVPAAATATGVDNCDTNSPVNFTVPVNTKGSNPANCNFYTYNMTRRWSVSDNCGNTTTYDQVVNVSDANAPTYSFPPSFTFNNNPGTCAGTASINLYLYVDDCAQDQYVSVFHTINGGIVQTSSNLNAVLPVGTHTVAVRAADPCGNVNNNAYVATFQIIIRDTESPTAVCQTGPIPVTLNSSGVANITPATVNNGSNDNCGIASMTVNPASFNCATTPNPHPVTLTVTDAAGNFNSCTTTVQITNVSAPTITCPAAANVICSVFNPADPATSGGSATAMTACGPVTPTYSDVTVSGPVNCRVITRTWTANTAGGSASCTQTITVTDPTPPSLVGVPANTTAQSCNVPTPATVTATDNCMTPSVTYGQTSTQGANPAVCAYYNYSITRTWSTTDGCNAGVSATQTITVSDTQAPAITVPNPLIVGTDPNLCNANLNINLADYIADCAADQYLAITRTSASAIGNGSGVITGVFPTGDYSITVTAVDPCGNSASQTFVLSIRDLQAPVAVCDPGITLILDNNGQGSLTPADVDEGSSDNCGTINLSISPSTFTLADVGVVPVVLTVTDNATPANSSTCTTPVTVIARGTLRASNTSGGNGSTVSVPISVTGFDNICALSGSLHLAGTAGNVTGVGGFNLTGLDAADFMVSGNNITFSWVNGSPVSLPDGTAIFNVNVQLTGAVGSTSTLTIDGTPTSLTMARCNASVVPITGVPGTVSVITVPSNVTLNGTIQRSNSTNVQLVNVGMIGSVNNSQTTGVAGTYSFTVPSGSNETITPVKDINDCNGINVLDVLILHQHVLGSAPLATPYLRIAADINNDGAINVLDELELHLIVLAGNPCIGLANNTSWRFVDAAYVFPNPNNPFSPPYPQNKVYTNVTTNQTTNFVGMKVGDLDFTANAATFSGGSVSDGSGAMFFNVDDQAVVAGNEYRIQFKASDFYDFVAFQYSLNFDQSVLKFKGMEAGALPRMAANNFGTANAGDGNITSIWYNEEPVTVSNGEVLFTLVFDAVGNANKLSDLLNIVADPLAAEAFTSSMEQKDMGITFNGSLSGTNDLAKGKIALYQNRPNPFGNETVIPFYLPSAMHVTLTISDISGKTVKVVNGDYAAGNHQVKLDNTQLPSTGVYFYRIDTEFGSAVKKMVLID